MARIVFASSTEARICGISSALKSPASACVFASSTEARICGTERMSELAEQMVEVFASSTEARICRQMCRIHAVADAAVFASSTEARICGVFLAPTVKVSKECSPPPRRRVFAAGTL